MARAAFSVLVLMVSGCNPVSQPFKVQRNLSYGPDARHAYDVYEPPYDTGRFARPAVIFIHGGGWYGGDKELAADVAAELCPQGYVVFAINYRLSATDPWPAQMEDCERAYVHIRDAGWANIREDRIAAFGVSAGGHLAAMLHLRGANRVPYAICASGAYDFVSDRSLDAPLELLLDVEGGGVAPLSSLVDASPITFARSDADMLLIHATGDPVVSYTQAEDFHSALLLENAEVTLLPSHSVGHARVWREGLSNIESWLAIRQGSPRAPGKYERVENDTRKLPGKVEAGFK